MNALYVECPIVVNNEVVAYQLAMNFDAQVSKNH